LDALKNASKKRVIIFPILFLKLNHLVWHVLSFNFVQINVNLLEKQLSTVILKMPGSLGSPCTRTGTCIHCPNRTANTSVGVDATVFSAAP
jgi:hypothetical protein